MALAVSLLLPAAALAAGQWYANSSGADGIPGYFTGTRTSGYRYLTATYTDKTANGDGSSLACTNARNVNTGAYGTTNCTGDANVVATRSWCGCKPRNAVTHNAGPVAYMRAYWYW